MSYLLKVLKYTVDKNIIIICLRYFQGCYICSVYIKAFNSTHLSGFGMEGCQ